MTTRAGIVGLGLGALLSGVLFYPFFLVWPNFFVSGWAPGVLWLGVVLLALAALLAAAGGGLAAAWGGALQADLRVGLGALAGSLAALVVFCSLGAAAAGLPGLSLMFVDEPGIEGRAIVIAMLRITRWTHGMFWLLMLSGTLLGALGGWRCAPVALLERVKPGKNDPMMALNAAITVMPAMAFAVLLAAGLFSRLPEVFQGNMQSRASVLLDWPLGTGLLLFLVTQLILLAVTRHEAQQAEHRCGIDEVKMAALVGIFVPIILAVGLGLIDVHLLYAPLTLSILLLSGGVVMRQVVTLFTLILPRRAQMDAPQDGVEAFFFGTISGSNQSSLILLCLGCGMLMVAPTYVVAAATAISMALAAGAGAFAPVALAQRLYAVQALAGLGLCLAAGLLLVGLYMFYSGLGRWFQRKRNDGASQPGD